MDRTIQWTLRSSATFLQWLADRYPTVWNGVLIRNTYAVHAAWTFCYPSQVFCHCDVAFSVCCVPKYSSQVPYCQLACILTALFIPMLVILTTYLFMISFEIKVLFNAACKPTAFYQRGLSPHLRQVAKCLKTRRCEQNFLASTVSKTHKLRCWQQPQISFYESLLRNQSCMSNNADYDNHSQECVFNWDARTLWFFNLENRFWSPQGSAPNFEPHSSLSSSDPRILDRRFLNRQSIRYHSSQTSGQTCHQNFVLWVLLVFFAGACRIGEAANPGPPPTPPYDPKLLSDTNDVLWVGNCNPGQLFGKEDIVLEWGGGIWTFSETSATTPAIKYLRSKFKEKNVMPFLGNLFVHTKILPSCVVGQGELQLFPNYHAESTISLHQISFIHQLDSWTRLLICMGADLSMYAQFMEQQIIINMIWQLLKIYSTRPLKELSLSVVRQ